MPTTTLVPNNLAWTSERKHSSGGTGVIDLTANQGPLYEDNPSWLTTMWAE